MARNRLALEAKAAKERKANNPRGRKKAPHSSAGRGVDRTPHPDGRPGVIDMRAF